MWSQAHHAVKDWADGGLTDIDSLASACGPHNRIVGDGPGQWRTFVVHDGPDEGKIASVPPEYIDPQRRPRINRVHHPDEALARARGEMLADRTRRAATRLRQLQRDQRDEDGEPDSDPPEPDEQ